MNGLYHFTEQYVRDLQAENDRLRGGYRRILDASNREMRDGDLAPDIAEEMLAGTTVHPAGAPRE